VPRSRRRWPCAAPQVFHRCARGAAGALPVACAQAVGAGDRGGYEGIRIAGSNAAPGRVVAQVFARRTVVECDDRYAAGECLEGHVAVGLGQAREQEQVAGGVVARKVQAVAHASEDDLGMALGERRADRAVADHDQACPWLPRADHLEGTHRELEVLLRGEPADMEDGQFIGGDPPSAAQRDIAVPRIEAGRVHRAAQQAHVAESVFAQERGQALGRHQRRRRAVVEAAQIGEHQRRQQAESVVGGKAVEAGMEAGAGSQAKFARRAQRAVAERALGGDVHGIGTSPRPRTDQVPLRGQADAQAGIAGQRRAGQEQLAEFRRRACAVLPAWAHDHDPVAELRQPARERLHGERRR
jgi:hypothetical protein